MFGNEFYYIRAIEEDDLSFLAEMRNDENTWPFLNTLNFANQPRQENWFKKSSIDSKQMNFIF